MIQVLPYHWQRIFDAAVCSAWRQLNISKHTATISWYVVYEYSSSQSNLPHRYRNSHAIEDHTVLPATRQKWYSCLYPSRSWYSIKRPRRDARLSCDLLLKIFLNVLLMTSLVKRAGVHPNRWFWVCFAASVCLFCCMLLRRVHYWLAKPCHLNLR